MTTIADEGLSATDLGHLTYLTGLADQPLDSWSGFYRSQSDGMNFGLRFQIAFAGYALYGLARRTPAYRAPYAEALHALVERMIAPPTWAYWFGGATRDHDQPKASGRRLEMVEMVHNRLSLHQPPPPADPCQQGNVQYSAHLASLLGFYQLLTNDPHYNREGFVLRATAGGQIYEFPYTHTSLAERIHAQMTTNHFGGVCCEPGRAYAACNNHACISNRLYDRLHGTELSEANAGWANWVRRRMLTGGASGKSPLPAPNGLLSVAYMPDLHLPIPVSFNLTDAWGLAFMTAWDNELPAQVWPRLRKRLRRGPNGELHLGSVGPNERVEISSTGLNTAFAAVMARAMGDELTFQSLRAWAEAHLEPTESAAGRYYAAAVPAAYVTALWSLALALPASGGGLATLLDWRPDFAAPYLARLTPLVGISRAVWQPANRTLEIELSGPTPTLITLEIENCATPSSATLNGVTVTNLLNSYDLENRILKLSLNLAVERNKLVVVC